MRGFSGVQWRNFHITYRETWLIGSQDEKRCTYTSNITIKHRLRFR